MSFNKTRFKTFFKHLLLPGGCLLDVIEMGLHQFVIKIENNLQEGYHNFYLYFLSHLLPHSSLGCTSIAVDVGKHIVVKPILYAGVDLTGEFLRLFFCWVGHRHF